MNGSIRTFYILLLTQTLSLIGSQMTGFAIGIQIFKDTGAVLPLALIKIAYAIPMIFALGFAGVAADRWNRRWILILSDAGQAIGTFLLLILLISGQFQLWYIYGIVIFQSLFGIFQHPAFQASVTMLVPDDKRDHANAIQQVTNPAAGIIAPALAGVLFTIIGVDGIIVLDLLTFGFAIIVLFFIRIPNPERSQEGQALQNSVWLEVTAGFRVLWQRRILFYLIVSIMGVNFLWNIYSALETPYILTVTNSEVTLGIMLSLASAGYMIGGLLMTVWRIKGTRMRILLRAIIAIGGFMLLFGLMRTPVLMTVTLFLFYIPHPIVNTLLTSILQLKTPPDTQGRVFAAVTQVAVLLSPIALLFGGVMADYMMKPIIGSSLWAWVEPIIGKETGSEMRLMIVLTGSIYFLIGIVLYQWSRMQQLETELPDV